MNLNISNILYILFRTSAIFVVLLILTRALGKKQMSQLTFFNYITGITIGSIAANVVSESNQPFIDEFLGLTWWCILTFLSGLLELKSMKLRRMIDGKPTILIRKGEIIKSSLKSTQFTMNDLSLLLRNQNIFSITEIDYAILEPNGSLSILKKPEHQEIKKSDMKIPTNGFKYVPTALIIDGNIIDNNLKILNLNNQWLKTQLQKQNIYSAKDVFYAEIQSDGSLFVNKN